MKNLNKNKNKLVYYKDLGRLLTDIAGETIDKTLNDPRGVLFCCDCGGIRDESMCGCIKRKEQRDGTTESFTGAGMMNLDVAIEMVMTAANKTSEALRAGSFVCECPPPETEMKNK